MNTSPTNTHGPNVRHLVELAFSLGSLLAIGLFVARALGLDPHPDLRSARAPAQATPLVAARVWLPLGLKLATPMPASTRRVVTPSATMTSTATPPTQRSATPT